MKSIKNLVLLPLAAVVLAGCTQQATTTTQDEVMVEESTTVPVDAMIEETSDAMMEEADFTVEMAPFSFTPSTMTVQAGDTVRVKIVNKEGMHDFVIDELDVKSSQLTEVDESEVIEFTVPADASGETYEYYCSVGEHRAMGMVGTLVVE